MQDLFSRTYIRDVLERHQVKNDAENYILISAFYEYCSTIKLSKKDWCELISVIPTSLSGELMKRTLEDLSTLLKRRQSDLNTDILSYILAQLGNVNSNDSDSLAERISQLYFAFSEDESELIDILLKMMPRNVHIFNLMKIRYRKELRKIM